jgi:hypothetical protein
MHNRQIQPAVLKNVCIGLEGVSATLSHFLTIETTAKDMEHLFSHSYLWSDSDEDSSSNFLKMPRNEGGPLPGIIRRMGYHLDKHNAGRAHKFDEYKEIGGLWPFSATFHRKVSSSVLT